MDVNTSFALLSVTTKTTNFGSDGNSTSEYRDSHENRDLLSPSSKPRIDEREERNLQRGDATDKHAGAREHKKRGVKKNRHDGDSKRRDNDFVDNNNNDAVNDDDNNDSVSRSDDSGSEDSEDSDSGSDSDSESDGISKNDNKSTIRKSTTKDLFKAKVSRLFDETIERYETGRLHKVEESMMYGSSGLCMFFIVFPLILPIVAVSPTMQKQTFKRRVFAALISACSIVVLVIIVPFGIALYFIVHLIRVLAMTLRSIQTNAALTRTMLCCLYDSSRESSFDELSEDDDSDDDDESLSSDSDSTDTNKDDDSKDDDNDDDNDCGNGDDCGGSADKVDTVDDNRDCSKDSGNNNNDRNRDHVGNQNNDRVDSETLIDASSNTNNDNDGNANECGKIRKCNADGGTDSSDSDSDSDGDDDDDDGGGKDDRDRGDVDGTNLACKHANDANILTKYVRFIMETLG